MNSLVAVWIKHTDESNFWLCLHSSIPPHPPPPPPPPSSRYLYINLAARAASNGPSNLSSSPQLGCIIPHNSSHPSLQPVSYFIAVIISCYMFVCVCVLVWLYVHVGGGGGRGSQHPVNHSFLLTFTLSSSWLPLTTTPLRSSSLPTRLVTLLVPPRPSFHVRVLRGQGL